MWHGRVSSVPYSCPQLLHVHFLLLVAGWKVCVDQWLIILWVHHVFLRWQFAVHGSSCQRGGWGGLKWGRGLAVKSPLILQASLRLLKPHPSSPHYQRLGQTTNYRLNLSLALFVSISPIPIGEGGGRLKMLPHGRNWKMPPLQTLSTAWSKKQCFPYIEPSVVHHQSYQWLQCTIQ